jgi:hypothetical protein
MKKLVVDWGDRRMNGGAGCKKPSKNSNTAIRAPDFTAMKGKLA